LSVATCAAYGVDLREPLKPHAPAELQVRALPFVSAIVTIVLLKDALIETIPLDKIKFVGYAFQIEMKFTAWKYGFNVQEVPIIFTDRTKGQSKMSSKIFKEAIFGVLQMKIGSLFRHYKRDYQGAA
jgi:dolichol-phosphate mannosyltransferase